ncbi:hypothetical protein [Arcobacter sp. LA11]|uniref:hypothetical protein n=1 Tax=Arcobacter sp. LA11 TaxID=1898176 RepID=UPI000933E1C4|nr:hypothetical protein [Arcobacter sp. LA11]
MEEEFRELSEKDLTYKPRKNYSYIIANVILESICYHNKINEPLEVYQFKDIEFYNWIDGNEDILEVLNKSTNIYKEATRIIRIFNLVKYKRPKYELSTEKWFKERSFSIEDNTVLKELMPLLLYYVGNCYEGSYTLFFEKLDFLIEYVIKPAIEHNESFEKERSVIDSINSLEEVLILDEDNNEVFVVAIKIKLSRASNNKVEKILVYEDNEDSSIKETSINRVVLKQKISNEKMTSSSFNSMLSYKSNFTDYEDSYNGYIEALLECDSYIYEYFQLKPLKNMQVFDTEERKKELIRNEIYPNPKDNKFYIIADDTEERILSTVLHCLPHAAILENDYLNEKLIQKFKDYSKGVGFDICPPPNNSDEPSSDFKSEIEDKNSEKEENKNKQSSPSDEENIIMKDLNKNIF